MNKMILISCVFYTIFIIWFYHESMIEPILESSRWSNCHLNKLDVYQTSPYAFCDGGRLFWGDGSIVQQDL